MKKSLIALAVLAAAGAASAQSSVTLYGRLDLGMIQNKVTENSTTSSYNGSGQFINNSNVYTNSTNKTTDLFGAQNSRTTSRLGVKGEEDLGGGTKAFFNYEFRINPDVSGSSVLTTRLANVGLRGSFGQVQIGTFLNALDDVRGYSASTTGIAGGDAMAKYGRGEATTDTGLSGRSQNALGYGAKFGDFTVKATLASTRTKTDGSTTTSNTVTNTSSDGKIQGYGLSVGYASGPISAQIAYGSAKQSSVTRNWTTTNGTVTSDTRTNTGGKPTDVALALSYDFGMAKPYFIYEQSKLKNSYSDQRTVVNGTFGANSTWGPDSAKNRAWEIGSTFSFGAFRPYVSYAQGKFTADRINAYTGTTSNYTEKVSYPGVSKSRAWQLGTLYDISKRTYVYAAFGQERVKTTGASESTYTITNAGTSAQTTTLNGYGIKDSVKKTTGFGLGVVHMF